MKISSEPPIPGLIPHLHRLLLGVLRIPNFFKFFPVLHIQLKGFLLSHIHSLVQCMPPCYQSLRSTFLYILLIHSVCFTVNLVLRIDSIRQSILCLLFLLVIAYARIHLFDEGIYILVKMVFHSAHKYT
jgi:hypothetical protein